MANLLHPPEVRRRNQYSRWLLYDALKCVLRGKMSCHQAAIRYKVPRSTIQRKIHMCREQHRLALELKLQHEIRPSSCAEPFIECPTSPEAIIVSQTSSNNTELTSFYDYADEMSTSIGVKDEHLEQIPLRFCADDNDLVEVCDDAVMIRSVLKDNERISPSTVQLKEGLITDFSNCDYVPEEHPTSTMNRRISMSLESDHDYRPTQSLDQFSEDQIDFCGEEHVIGSFEEHDDMRSPSTSNDSMYYPVTNTICDPEDDRPRSCIQDSLIPQPTDCYQMPSTSIAFDSNDNSNSDNNSEYNGVDDCKNDNRSVMFYDSSEFGYAQDNIIMPSTFHMNDVYVGSSLSTPTSPSSSSNAGYHSVAFGSGHDADSADSNGDLNDDASSASAIFLNRTEADDGTNEMIQLADDRQFLRADDVEIYGDELVRDVDGEHDIHSQSDGTEFGGTASFSRDALPEIKLAVDGGDGELVSFTEQEPPPKRRRHFIVTKRAFRPGRFNGLRTKVDTEEEELERAADRLSEAFRSVPSRSRLPKYMNRHQEHQTYAFQNHGTPFATRSHSQPRVLVPAKFILAQRHHRPREE